MNSYSLFKKAILKEIKKKQDSFDKDHKRTQARILMRRKMIKLLKCVNIAKTTMKNWKIEQIQKEELTLRMKRHFPRWLSIPITFHHSNHSCTIPKIVVASDRWKSELSLTGMKKKRT